MCHWKTAQPQLPVPGLLTLRSHYDCRVKQVVFVAVDTCSEVDTCVSAVLDNVRSCPPIRVNSISGVTTLDTEGDFTFDNGSVVTMYAVDRAALPSSITALIGMPTIRKLGISLDHVATANSPLHLDAAQHPPPEPRHLSPSILLSDDDDELPDLLEISDSESECSDDDSEYREYEVLEEPNRPQPPEKEQPAGIVMTAASFFLFLLALVALWTYRLGEPASAILPGTAGNHSLFAFPPYLTGKEITWGDAQPAEGILICLGGIRF
jgi:hypothetical protein